MTLEEMQKRLELVNKIHNAKQNAYVPVTSTYQNNTKKKNWLEEFGSNIFQKASNWENGYQAGDLLKTAGASAADAGLNIYGSVAKGMEGISKLMALGVAQGADWLGKDKFADAMRKEISNEQNDAYLSPKVDAFREKYIEPYSVLGSSSDQVSSGIGSTIFSAATSVIPGIGSKDIGKLKNVPIAMGLSEMGNSVAENYSKEDITDAQAWLNGAGKGTVSAISESIFGAFGVGGSELDDVLVKSVTKNVNSQLVKGMAQLGIKAGGEAAEEFLEYAGGYLTNLATDYISQGKGAEFYQQWNSDEVLQSMLTSFISTGITQGGGTVNNIIKGNDVVTGNNTDLQNVITQAVNEEVKDRQKKGEKVTMSQRIQIENQMTELLSKENIASIKHANEIIQNSKLKNSKIDNNDIQLKKELTTKIENVKNLDKSTRNNIINIINNMKNSTELNNIKSDIEAIENAYSDKNESIIAPIDKNTTIKQNYAKYKNAALDKRVVNTAMELVETNKQNKRTKEQWLKVAEQIGNNITSQEAEMYAYKTWIDMKPNNKENLNRQGKSYVPFTLDEWVDKVKEASNKVQDANIQKNAPSVIQDADMQVTTKNMIRPVNNETNSSSSKSYYESAKKHNIDVNNSAVKAIYNLANKRGINVRYDDSIFNDTNQSAIWKRNQDGSREIILNPKATTNRALQTIMLHEIVHDMEGTAEYNELRKIVLDYAKKQKNYDNARKNLEDMYSSVYDKNSNDFESLIDQEVVADILGEKLGDQEFINSLVKQNRNVAQKIYDWVIDKLNSFSQSIGFNSEYLYWKNVENKFRNAFNSDFNNYTSGVKYHISSNLSNEIDSVLKGEYISSEDVKLRDYTPEILVELGLNDLPMLMNQNHLKENILSKSKARKLGILKDNTNYHNLGKKLFMDIIDSLDSPLMVMKSISPTGKNNSWVVVTDVKNQSGEQVIVPIYLNTKGNYNSLEIDTNKVKTIYGKSNIRQLVDNTIKGDINNILYMTKDVKKRKLLTTTGLQLSNYSVTSNNIIIPSKENYVNDKQENSFLTKDNKGRQLSQQQQEYFKDSKVRDDNGNLLEVYHGTPYTFNIFNYEKLGENTSSLGAGFYFTDVEQTGSEYVRGEGELKKVYLDIKKPMSYGKTTMTKGEYQTFVEAINKETNGRYFEDYDGLENALMEYEYGGDDIDLVNAVHNASGLSWEKTFEILRNRVGYDGVISEKGFINKNETIYVAFNANQIKNVDNTNPTDSDDIRYSKESNGEYQKFLKDNFSNNGTKTTMSEVLLPSNENRNISPTAKTNKVMNPVEIANLTEKDASSTPIAPTRNYGKGNKESRFYRNVTSNSKFLNQELRQELKNEDDVRFYQGVTNEESLTNALKKLNDGGENETLSWFNKDSFDAEDVAEGWILMKRYQDAGDYRGVVEVIKKMRNQGTTAGQTIQAFNIMNRLTPEGMVNYAQGELSEAFEKMSKNKTKEWIDANREKFELTPEETAFIMNNIQEAQTLESDSRERAIKLGEIQKVMKDKLPPDKGAGIKAWMRISMLFNPKTQVRNVAGNAIIAPVNAVSDIVSAGVDKVLSKKTGVRTTGVPNLKSMIKGAGKGLYNSYDDFKRDINTRNMTGNRYEFNEGDKKSFNTNTSVGKGLYQVERLLSFMLDAGDRVFYEASFVNSINNQKVLNNSNEVTQDMIDIATNEALSRTWQDNNEYTKFVLGIRRTMNKFNIGGYGLGDVLIPFAKTPANLTKAIIDYSPVGVVSAINSGRNLKNSLTNGQYTAQMQHDFVQKLGKATAGTMLYVLGYALAKAGITTGESDEDKDVANFMKNTLGTSNYSIKIGDKTFQYDWAQPVAAPIAMMANLVGNKKDEEKSLQARITETLDVPFNMLLEQSFLSSIQNVFSNNQGVVQGIEEQILDLPSRAVPTLFKQVADLIDPTQRQTYVKGDMLATAKNKVIAKIPGASKMLAPTVDTLGREVKKYGGDNGIFNVFFNPANVNSSSVSRSAREIYNLYKSTGDKTIFPRVAGYSLTYDGNTYNLSPEERATYQKTMGTYANQTISKMLNNKSYESLTDIEKTEIINRIVSDANEYAKEEYAKNNDIEYERKDMNVKVDEQISKGLEIPNAYIYKTIINSIEGEKGVEYSELNKKLKYVMNMETSDTQKQLIIDLASNDTDYNVNVKDLNKLNEDYSVYLKQSGKKPENGGLSPREKYIQLVNANIPVEQLNKYYSEISSIEGRKDSNGKTVSGSKKQAVFDYVNSLKLTIPQKQILLAKQYTSFATEYHDSIVTYLNSLNISGSERKSIYNSIYN